MATWSATVAEWFGDDLQRWTQLRKWVDNLAATRQRELFEAAVPDPHLNRGRPVSTRPARVLPGDAALDPAAMAQLNQAAVDNAIGFLTDAMQTAEASLHRVIEYRTERRGRAVVTELRSVGPKLGDKWATLAAWSYDPTQPPQG